MSREGALLAAGFSFMPNCLGYCGPEENRALLQYLADGHSDRGLEQILARFAGAFPYYSFIAAASSMPVRTGHEAVRHSLETMDACRISWGRVVADHGDTLLVERRPLRLAGDEIAPGPPEPRSVLRRFDGKTFLDEVHAEDAVAVHWGCACYRLTARQLRWLAHYTRRHLALANEQRRSRDLVES